MHPRFYCPELADLAATSGSQFELSPAVSHHADRVLRLRPGATVSVFDGAGQAWVGQLVEAGKRCVVALTAPEEGEREAPLAISLVQALAVGDKMDWVVQKAVELGVSAVQPIAAERSVLRLDGERAAKRVQHWQQIAIGAAEQCGRQLIMPVHNIVRLADWLAQPATGERWILDHEAGTALSQAARPTGPLSVLIGPEGGWSPAELAAAHAAGCHRVKMGPRTLRTETVGTAIAAALLTRWGDF